MGFLGKLFGLEQNQNMLLSAKIVTDEDFKFFIQFNKYNPLQLDEYVRLVLHYYANILFDFDPHDYQMSEAANILKNMVNALLSNGLRKDSKVFQMADIDDVSSMVSSPPGNNPMVIVATLYSMKGDMKQRVITIDLPSNGYAQHMVFSVAALIQAVITQIDQENIEILNRSLYFMNKAYESGVRYSEFQNLIDVPNKAYYSTLK